MNSLISRRGFLAALNGLALMGAGPVVLAETQLIPAKSLKPGQWEWYPERSPSGPVVVVVTLGDQLAYVYRNGIRVGVSTVSSGKKGFETPTGVFTVLRKERMHHSHKYHNAAMPDSEFFFGGAALHAGDLPGYPSSHGCVHLPRKFANLVFGITHNGTPVIVTNQHSGTGSLSHAGLLLANSDLKQLEEMTGNVRSKTLPVDEKGYSKSAFSVVVSGADSKVFGFDNGDVVLESPVEIKDRSQPLGEHVYVLRGAHETASQLHWIAIGVGSTNATDIDKNYELATARRVVIPYDASRKISENLHPGSTFVITDLPAHPATRTGNDFVVMRVGEVG